MAVILPYEDLERQIQNSGYYFSDADLALAKQNPEAGWQIYNAKRDYAAATTPEARALANATAENVRKQYGSYTGGSAGDQYNPFGATNATSFTGATNNWANAGKTAYEQMTNYPSWQNSDAYTKALNNYLNYGPFEYDYKTDPLYGVYKKEYTREGQRAMADTLAQAATMTGGVPSSYATTAAQQANNYYASKIADAIPALRQQAYNEYNQEFQNLLAKYNAAYQDNNFNYGVYSDDYNRLMGQMDAAYGRYDTEYGQALDAAAVRAAYGDLGGYDSVLGTDLQSLYDAQKAENEMANAIYAFADDGGEPYRIGSTLGKSYINSLMPGQSVRASDGSVWSMDELGNITITDVNGRTYRIKSGQTLSGSGKYQAPEDTTPFSDATWKQINQLAQSDPNTAAALLQQYWSKLTESQKNILARAAGIDPKDLAASGGMGNISKDDFSVWASLLPQPVASGTTYDQMAASGINTYADAVKYFTDTMGLSATNAAKAAEDYLSSVTSGGADNLASSIGTEVKDYKSAVNYLQNNGKTATPLTQEQWAASSQKSVFATYQDYLKAFAYEHMNG